MGTITKSDIEQFAREGCGVCDSWKMRRASFRDRAVSDKTPVPVGKRWVFDTLTLRTPAAFTGDKYLTRFVNLITSDDGNQVPGKKRTYGHRTMEEPDLEACIQLLRAYVRPFHGEIHIVKRDGHPTHKAKDMMSYLP